MDTYETLDLQPIQDGEEVVDALTEEEFKQLYRPVYNAVKELEVARSKLRVAEKKQEYLSELMWESFREKSDNLRAIRNIGIRVQYNRAALVSITEKDDAAKKGFMTLIEELTKGKRN